MSNLRHRASSGKVEYDFLIVGAGFAGLVAAERLCNKYGKRCLIVEKRTHIGGNAYDSPDANGVLVHTYGPHYFRTNSQRILDYLSRFTEWISGNYRVQIFRDNRYWSFPINLKTFEQYIGRDSTSGEMREWLEAARVRFDEVTNSEEAVLSQVGPEWYRMFFEGYTLKQWKRPPSELCASVCRRIPIRTERDERYFNDTHQVLPKRGYAHLFKNLAIACGARLDIRLNTNYRTILAGDAPRWRHLIFTGPIDEFFDYRHGPLPYRSLRFEPRYYSTAEILSAHADRKVPRPETSSPTGAMAPSGSNGNPLRLCLQPCVQVNYPGPEPWTRTVEAKHITGQEVEGTTVVSEFPDDYAPGKEPYYPVPNDESAALYRRYKEDAATLPDVSFLGRLGTYRYYNMDQVVGSALAFVDNLYKADPADVRSAGRSE